MQHFKVYPILFMAFVLIGCGGPPADNPLLGEARQAYTAAEQNPQVVRHAPVALEEAGDALSEAERAWRKKKDKEVVDHHAYLAKQRVHIAEETAKLNAAESEIEDAEVERQKVMLEAREQEVEQAQAQAEANRQAAAVALEAAEAREREARIARNEAERAKLEAEKALARAEELALRVEQLEAEQTERGLVLTLGDVLFDVDKATLKTGGARAVEELATFLTEYPERKVLIEGFTDNTGSDSYNKELSHRRADAVQAALVERGIARTRIETIGYGENYPVATNDTAAGRQQNRRVEVIISDKEGLIPARQ